MSKANSNGFDRIARFYDKLARLVFGKSIVESQLFFLHKIPEHSHVLIIGGGTGWLLKTLVGQNSACKVTYVDASAEMIKSAKNSVPDYAERINFIHGTENSIPETDQYDIVITNFFLDLFSNQNIDALIRKVLVHLKPASLWIATDFYYRNRLWQRGLLMIMYKFFRVVAGIQNQKLPNWDRALKSNGLMEMAANYYFLGFIKTALYKLEL